MLSSSQTAMIFSASAMPRVLNLHCRKGAHVKIYLGGTQVPHSLSLSGTAGASFELLIHEETPFTKAL